MTYLKTSYLSAKGSTLVVSRMGIPPSTKIDKPQAEGRAVVVETGRTGLDYVLHFHVESSKAERAEIERRSAAECSFPLRLDKSGISVRDAKSNAKFALSGRIRHDHTQVTAHWIPTTDRKQMLIHLFVEPVKKPGTPVTRPITLRYDVRATPTALEGPLHTEPDKPAAHGWRELHDPKARKAWAVRVVGTAAVTHYGRLRETGRTSTKACGTAEKAEAFAEKQARSKLAKGYINGMPAKLSLAEYLGRKHHGTEYVMGFLGPCAQIALLVRAYRRLAGKQKKPLLDLATRFAQDPTQRLPSPAELLKIDYAGSGVSTRDLRLMLEHFGTSMFRGSVSYALTGMCHPDGEMVAQRIKVSSRKLFGALDRGSLQDWAWLQTNLTPEEPIPAAFFERPLWLAKDRALGAKI